MIKRTSKLALFFKAKINAQDVLDPPCSGDQFVARAL